MLKIIAYSVELVQDDIDYLHMKAAQYLDLYNKTKNFPKRAYYFQLFQAYNDLYEANKQRVKPDKT